MTTYERYLKHEVEDEVIIEHDCEELADELIKKVDPWYDLRKIYG